MMTDAPDRAADEAKAVAAALIARSQAVVEDCARMRGAQPVPMTIAEAVELGEYIARTPDAVVSEKRLREAVRVLASEMQAAK